MAKPRAFISFQMEDKWARDFLKEHAKNKNNEIEFYDYSVKDPFETKWKTECRKRIAMTRGTIVLIGRDTWTSKAVEWEIAETLRQDHHIFGIQINSTSTHIIPTGLSSSDVIRWNFDQIVERLSKWG